MKCLVFLIFILILQQVDGNLIGPKILGSQTGEQDIREQIEVLGKREQMEETMFLGLRMAKGVDCERFRECFGQTPEEIYGRELEESIREGLLEVHPEGPGQGRRYVLTKRGVDVSNYVMAKFLKN